MAVTPSAQRAITDFFDSPLNVSKLQPLMTSTPLPGANRKRKQPVNDKDQLLLDFGQKGIGRIDCKECGMVYSADDEKDKKAHNTFHNRFTDIKYFKVEKRSMEAWKKNLYYELNSTGKFSGTFFKMEKKNRIALKTKVETIIKEFIDVQLDICADVPVFEEKKDSMAFVFISDGIGSGPIFIGALCIVQRVFAAKLMPLGKIYKDNLNNPGYAAVERLWVHPLLRRKGVASRMLDVVLRCYAPEIKNIILRSRIAFVEPTPTGIEFAKAYLGKHGKWIQHDGDEEEVMWHRGRLGIVCMAERKKEDAGNLKKSENSEGIKPPTGSKIVIKKEKDVNPVKVVNKENILPSKKPDPSKKRVKKEDEEVEELYKTVVIDEENASDSAVNLQLLPEV